MDPRQAKLFNLVMEKFIATAEPIGSKFLVATGKLDWSEATVRNELRALEEAGYLTHPHTSAGRIPTLKGYQYYVHQLDLKTAKPTKKESALLESAIEKNKDYEAARKNVAKELVELSDETVIIAFTPDLVYYTGLTNLFQKPDFAELKQVASVSEVFDRCDELLSEFFNEVDTDPRYFLGGEHPFGEMLSVLSARFGKDGESLIALLGPSRMDYKHNWGLMQKVIEII